MSDILCDFTIPNLRLRRSANSSQGTSLGGRMWRAALERKLRETISWHLSAYATPVSHRHIAPSASRPIVSYLLRGSRGKLDDDNLVYAFKSSRDEIAKFFGVPDDHPHMRWVYSSYPLPAGQWAVRIIICQGVESVPGVLLAQRVPSHRGVFSRIA